MWMNRGIVRLTLQIFGLPVSLTRSSSYVTPPRFSVREKKKRGSGKVFGSCSAAFPGFLKTTSLIATVGVCAECEREPRNWWGLNPCSRCVCVWLNPAQGQNWSCGKVTPWDRSRNCQSHRGKRQKRGEMIGGRAGEIWRLVFRPSL